MTISMSALISIVRGADRVLRQTKNQTERKCESEGKSAGHEEKNKEQNRHVPTEEKTPGLESEF